MEIKLITTENKSSFFFITLPIKKSHQTEFYLDNLDDAIDLICSSMQVSNVFYKIKDKENNILCLFKSDNRKRKGQLNRFCVKFLPDEQEFSTEAITKFDFITKLEIFKKNKFNIIAEPSTFANYNGSDIKIFDDIKSWHPWQKFLHDELFHSNGQIKEADHRTIISLVDTKGNSGKTSFFKWLLYNHPNDIGRIGYGTTSQLRSSTVKLGDKPIYIIDLSRSRGKNDSEEDLLAVIEEIKSGFLVNVMYGNAGSMMMTPPHVIVTSNYELSYDLLSGDRWKTYKINEKYQAIPFTAKKRKSKDKKKNLILKS